MTYNNMLISCKIFAKYDLDKEYFEADHDIIYGPSVDVEFNETDALDLEELGWHKSDEYDCWAAFC